MKSYELKPTSDNLFDTFNNNLIGRNADVFRFTEILDSIEDGCSVALDGKWGSGKTFFVKQVKMVMDAHNNFIDHTVDDKADEIVQVRGHYYGEQNFDLQPQVCVYYDAWENDNDEDPVISLVYAILNSVDTDFDFKNTDYVRCGASVMEAFSGKNWTQLIANLKGTSPLDALKQQKSVDSLVSDFLESLIPEKGNRLVVFIDELDRCKPSYAVRLLERVKHYFSNSNITFVFSVNMSELQYAVKKHYGESFDGSKYLERFFELKITLPPPDLDRYYQSLNFSNSNYIFDNVCDAVIKVYHMELREIAKFLRLAKIAAYEPTHNGKYSFRFPDGKALQFCLCYIVPIMIGLKVTDPQRYMRFIVGEEYAPMVEIAEYLSTIVFLDSLLNKNETFEEGEKEMEYVTLNEKMKAVYDAIFVTAYTGTKRHTVIGNMEFDGTIKNKLLETVSLFSQFTNLDVD